MTKTDVANLALSKIGEPIIDDITDTGDRVARIASLHYEPTLREVLRAHFWDFAMAASQSLETYAGDAKASLTLFDGVADSGIVIEAVANGPEGNEISVAVAAGNAAASDVSITVSGKAIVITPPARTARMMVTGTLTSDGSTPVVVPVLTRVADFSGYPAYYSDPNPDPIALGFPRWQLLHFPGQWVLRYQESVFSTAYQWISTGDGATPDAATWTGSAQSPATGVPSFAPETDNTAADIITAINADSFASLLVTAENQEDSDGSAVVGTAAAANLSGGTTTPIGWQKAFLMPADFIKLRRVLTADGARIDKFDFRRIAGQRCLVTGDHDSVIMEYVQFVDDPDAYDPLFLEAFATFLASKLARAVTGSEAMEAELRQAYEFSALPAARTADSHDSQSGENRPIDDIISGGLLRPRGDFLTDLDD